MDLDREVYGTILDEQVVAKVMLLADYLTHLPSGAYHDFQHDSLSSVKRSLTGSLAYHGWSSNALTTLSMIV